MKHTGCRRVEGAGAVTLHETSTAAAAAAAAAALLQQLNRTFGER